MKACIKLDENDKDLFESFMLLIVRTYEEDFKELHAAYKMKSVLLRMSEELVQSFQTEPTNYLIRSYEIAKKMYCAFKRKCLILAIQFQNPEYGKEINACFLILNIIPTWYDG